MGSTTLTSFLQSLAVVLLSVVFWTYVKRRSSKATVALQNIPGPESRSWWKGNFEESLSPATGTEYQRRLLKEFDPVVRLDGMMGDKVLYLYDPKAMHHVLVKDQALFERTNVPASGLMFGKGLGGITGEAHRKQRKALNPVFSIAHMRDMLPIFYDVIHKLEQGLTSRLQNGNGPQEVEMLSWASRTAFELIGQAGLGYSFDTLTDEANAHPYTKVMKDVVPTTARMHKTRYFLPIALKLGTPKLRRWIMNMLPLNELHRMRDISDYLWAFSKQLYRGKLQALRDGDEAVAQQVGKGKDVMSILIKLNLEANDEDRLEEDEVLGQMSLLMFAAMDTTSSALARTFHLLAMHPEVQDKLRQELLEAQQNNADIPYDQLVSLPYLDAVCRETLRLFSPVPYVLRHAKQDTVLPLSTPIKGVDGTTMSEIHVPQNTRVVISVLNSNRHAAIWGPDALEWKPERWLSPLPDELIEAHVPGVYSHLMTFNAGGRSCIGFKFSQLEMKALLSLIVAKFKFEPSKKEIVWVFNDIISPTVKGEDNRRSQMPMFVSSVEE
ncbi:hypothetical protein D9758_013703 [Tetrapyrgos nigripes]|uniref:Cytochrome P450 n=1 Tax=Tetrapyrgos nigripes TaxID=182062 RepID=A0A8H5CKI5_9AGAR|nr:hypothetical protein D9758_013703 [Tetrapyrgos nigripes]